MICIRVLHYVIWCVENVVKSSTTSLFLYMFFIYIYKYILYNWKFKPRSGTCGKELKLLVMCLHSRSQGIKCILY